MRLDCASSAGPERIPRVHVRGDVSRGAPGACPGCARRVCAPCVCPVCAPRVRAPGARAECAPRACAPSVRPDGLQAPRGVPFVGPLSRDGTLSDPSKQDLSARRAYDQSIRKPRKPHKPCRPRHLRNVGGAVLPVPLPLALLAPAPSWRPNPLHYLRRRPTAVTHPRAHKRRARNAGQVRRPIPGEELG